MKRFPLLVGEVDALQHGLHQRPLPVGLQPEQRYQISVNALIKQRYHLKRKLDTLAKQRNQLSLNALIKQRNHLRDGGFSCHTQEVDACENGL